MTPERAAYLALGDSYTIGEGVAPEARWPARLAGLLAEAGKPVREPVFLARTGWTTDELERALDGAGLEGRRWALVSLQIGVNDQYRGGDAERYRARFAALLERAVALAGGKAGRVLVLSIPDWGVTPFAAGRDRSRIAAEIDAFNRANREEALRRGARYVDVTGISRAAGELAADGLHPGAAQYARWAEATLPAAAAALSP